MHFEIAYSSKMKMGQVSCGFPIFFLRSLICSVSQKLGTFVLCITEAEFEVPSHGVDLLHTVGLPWEREFSLLAMRCGRHSWAFWYEGGFYM